MYCPQLPGQCNRRRALQGEEPLEPTDEIIEETIEETMELEVSDTDLKAGRNCKLLTNGKKDAWRKARRSNAIPVGWNPDDTNIKVYSCRA